MRGEINTWSTNQKEKNDFRVKCSDPFISGHSGNYLKVGHLLMSKWGSPSLQKVNYVYLEFLFKVNDWRQITGLFKKTDGKALANSSDFSKGDQFRISIFNC